MNVPQRPRRAPTRRREWRAALTAGAPIVFLPAVLSLADRGTILGVPSLVVFVFAAWLAGIVLMALVARPGPDE
ncbi:MAG: hypothetical protein AAF318_07605 [Pseudomonadota bacterium]